MQHEGSIGNGTTGGDDSGGFSGPDLEKQENSVVLDQGDKGQGLRGDSALESHSKLLTIVVTRGDEKLSKDVESSEVELHSVSVTSPKKGSLSRTNSSHEQCRVCQQDKEEDLIDLGCLCRGGLAKAHRSCIDTWFRTRGSNKCEICRAVAVNVPPPETQPSTNYWVWRIDPTFRPRDRERGCFSPLWVAFSILIGGLMLDVLISITFGVSALPINIIIGVIVVLGLGTALRLALEFCREWSLRRVVQRVETNVNLGYHPAL